MNLDRGVRFFFSLLYIDYENKGGKNVFKFVSKLENM